MDEEDIKREKQLFVSLYKARIAEEIIIWEGNDYIGFSILRNYPENTKFHPVKYPDGKHDTTALIKIGYATNNIHTNTLPLRVSISKASRYIFEKHFFNFSDENCPNEKEVDISKKSPQPTDLEENNRYEYNLPENKIWDKNNKEYTDLNKVVDLIYDEHLQTISNRFIKYIGLLRDITFNTLTKIIEFLIKTNEILFGKKIVDTDNPFTGKYNPYKPNVILDAVLTNPDNYININGIQVPISPNSAVTVTFTLSFIYILHYLYKFDFLHLVEITNQASDNALFYTSIIISLLFIWDKILPIVIFYTVNTLIKMKTEAMYTGVNISFYNRLNSLIFNSRLASKLSDILIKVIPES